MQWTNYIPLLVRLVFTPSSHRSTNPQPMETLPHNQSTLSSVQGPAPRIMNKTKMPAQPAVPTVWVAMAVVEETSKNPVRLVRCLLLRCRHMSCRCIPTIHIGRASRQPHPCQNEPLLHRRNHDAAIRNHGKCCNALVVVGVVVWWFGGQCVLIIRTTVYYNLPIPSHGHLTSHWWG